MQQYVSTIPLSLYPKKKNHTSEMYRLPKFGRGRSRKKLALGEPTIFLARDKTTN